MIKYIIVISVLISSVIFSQDIIHTEKHPTEDYIIYIEYHKKTPKGLVKTKKETYHPNGVMSSELHFKDGKEHGLNRVWYENGQLGVEYSLKNGKQDGKSTSWYPNGVKKIESMYKDGVLDGVSSFWGEGGHERSIILYEEGKIDVESQFGRPDSTKQLNDHQLQEYFQTHKELKEFISKGGYGYRK